MLTNISPIFALFTMDFSQYGHPSQEWLTFTATNPSAALDGTTGNYLSAASSLREAFNTARSAVSANLLASTGLDQRISITTQRIPTPDPNATIPLRIYKPNRPNTDLKGAVLYFHGGGYLLGNETSDDYLCSRIAEETSTTVLSVIYHHTHAHTHPAQVDDAWTAFTYIHDTFAPDIRKGLVVMGISAGCTLAASVMLRALETKQSSVITGAVLSIPWLIHIDNYPFPLFASRDVCAKVQNAEAPVIPSTRLRMFSDLLGAADPADRLLNVPLLSDEELRGWPRTAFLVAGMDPLRDDGLVFARRLEGLG
jgi:acetyl esterase/lipase